MTRFPSVDDTPRHHRHFQLLLLVCVLSSTLFAAKIPPVQAGQISQNDVARYLAGMRPAPTSPLAPWTRDPAWQAYATRFDAVWAQLERRQLSRISVWALANLPRPQRTMFYMFSGPDFLYANTFYRNATTYILSGLERIGPLPDVFSVRQEQLPIALDQLWASLDTILRWSYFITKDMQSQLTQGHFTGTLPVIYVFLARTGHRIDEVRFVSLNSKGAVTPVDGSRAARATGVRIRFTSREGVPKTLYYFRTDLSDSRVRRTGFLEFCKKLAPGDTLIKSASYLLHYQTFSAVRNFLLENSRTIVQDDSGIALRYFSRNDWDLRVFGTYVGPIPVFKDRYQDDLADLFRRSPRRALKFGIGYRYPPSQTNVLVAVRRGG